MTERVRDPILAAGEQCLRSWISEHFEALDSLPAAIVAGAQAADRAPDLGARVVLVCMNPTSQGYVRIVAARAGERLIVSELAYVRTPPAATVADFRFWPVDPGMPPDGEAEELLDKLWRHDCVDLPEGLAPEVSESLASRGRVYRALLIATHLLSLRPVNWVGRFSDALDMDCAWSCWVEVVA